MKDPGIWICLDEGCNENCHGKDWRINAESKLKLNEQSPYFIGQMMWLHNDKSIYKTIGDHEVKTLGKWKAPAGFRLEDSQKIVHMPFGSHEQEGAHPMLLSSVDQANLKLVKDMENGTC